MDWLANHPSLVTSVCVSLAAVWGGIAFHQATEHGKGFWASTLWGLAWMTRALDVFKGVRPDMQPTIDRLEAAIGRAEQVVAQIQAALPPPTPAAPVAPGQQPSHATPGAP